jgi:16S rRNA processing protein RimM
LELGYVSGVFGVRGEVRLFLHNPDTPFFDRPRQVTLIAPNGARRAATLAARSGAGRRIVGQISGVADRDAAAALNGTQIVVPRSALPVAKRGEWYVVDLLGADVFVGERRVGSLVAVHPTAGGDVLEIDVGAKDPAFVPLLERWVTGVDVAARRVALADDALLEENEGREADDEEDAP